jgi:hypothetical protein
VVLRLGWDDRWRDLIRLQEGQEDWRCRILVSLFPSISPFTADQSIRDGLA